MGITNSGFDKLAAKTGGVSTVADFDYLANGSDSTAFSATQTTLVSENTGSGLARAQVTPTQVQTNVANDTLRLSKTWSVTGTATVAEVAVLNAASGGTMLARTVLGAARTVTSGDSYTLQYDVIFA